MRIFVIAGTYQQFVSWAKENGIDPRNRHYIYVSSVQQLQGVREGELVLTGTWWDRPDIHELRQMVRVALPGEWEAASA